MKNHSFVLREELLLKYEGVESIKKKTVKKCADLDKKLFCKDFSGVYKWEDRTSCRCAMVSPVSLLKYHLLCLTISDI